MTDAVEAGEAPARGVAPGRHVALVGTTASGKSALALALAEALGDVELVSVDSMQVYRGMDIGTATPTAAERAAVPHHLLDVADPGEEFTVAVFGALVAEAVAGIEARGRRAVLVGGTGLYLRAALGELELPGQYPAVVAELEREPDTEALHTRLAVLDPVAAGRMEPTNRRRVVRALEVTIGSGRPFSSFGPGLTDYPPSPYRLLGIRLPRAVVDERIAARYQAQLEAGFLDEVRRLADRPGGLSRTAAQALGYRELLAHLAGETTLDEAIELAVLRTRRFARRQERWFRRDPRIVWHEPAVGEERNPMALLAGLLRDCTAPWPPPGPGPDPSPALDGPPTAPDPAPTLRD